MKTSLLNYLKNFLFLIVHSDVEVAVDKPSIFTIDAEDGEIDIG